jgi:hypothetical protein
MSYSGADPGFQVRGEHLKKLRRAEGGANIFGVFRVKNHDYTPKNHIFSNFGGRVRPAPVVYTVKLAVTSLVVFMVVHMAYWLIVCLFFFLRVCVWEGGLHV